MEDSELDAANAPRRRAALRRAVALATLLVGLCGPIGSAPSPSAPDTPSAASTDTGSENLPPADTDSAAGPTPSTRTKPVAESVREQEASRPSWATRRFDEDWSDFEVSEEDDSTLAWLDRIKHIPLTPGGMVWTSLGARLRSRVESWSDFGFGAGGSDTFWLNRAFYHADLHATEHARVFVEGKSAFALGRDLPGGRRAIDADDIDLHNGFVDLSMPLVEGIHGTLRAGRQELLFGKQRLISPLDWANTRRTFDGAGAILEGAGWNLTAFYTRPVHVRKYDFDQPDPQTDFYGAYATCAIAASTDLDVYLLGLSRDAAAVGAGFNGTRGREDRFTAGARVGGRVAETALDYDLEGAWQFGRIGGQDIEAWFLASVLGYTFQEGYGAPRVSVGLDLASGDRRRGGDVQTFHQLFPLGHAYLGSIDAIGRQNNGALNAGVELEVIEAARLLVRGHWFFRMERADALYDAGGNPVRPGVPGSSRDVGFEVDVALRRAFGRHLVAVVGYSHFFPGEFIRETGPSEAIDFVFVQIELTL